MVSDCWICALDLNTGNNTYKVRPNAAWMFVTAKHVGRLCAGQVAVPRKFAVWSQAVQQSTGALALGPIMQGLRLPVSWYPIVLCCGGPSGAAALLKCTRGTMQHYSFHHA